MVCLDYLEEERQKLWAKVNEIEEKLNNPSTIFGMRQKASEHKNKAQQSSEAAESYKKNIEALKDSTQKSFEQIKTLRTNIDEQAQTISEKWDKIKDIEIESKVSSFDDLVSKLEKIRSQCEDSEKLLTSSQERTDEIDKYVQEADNLIKKINKLHEDSKNYTEKNKTTYEDLIEKLDSFDSQLSDLKNKKQEEYKEFLETKKLEHREIKSKIDNLLPDALSAGLASAYEQKRKAEEQEFSRSANYFRRGLVVLGCISLIPLGLVVVLIWRGDDVNSVLLEIAKLVPILVSLYTPATWFSIVSNRQMNFSKRLIEEYTHKEVISKTFEGLSKQAEILEEEGVQDLKIKLIRNLIDITTDNPGKLMKGFNEADHPILNIIDVHFGKISNTLNRLPEKTIDRLMSFLENHFQLNGTKNRTSSAKQEIETNQE